MGQAAVNLPDPLEPAAAPTAANADDLLSQLAGDEIDRMLAEVGAEVATSSPTDGMTPTTEPANTPVAASPAQPVAENPLSDVPAPEQAAADVSAQLDQLFSELNESTFPGAPSAPAAATPAAAAVQPPSGAPVETGAEEAPIEKQDLQALDEAIAKQVPKELQGQDEEEPSPAAVTPAPPVKGEPAPAAAEKSAPAAKTSNGPAALPAETNDSTAEERQALAAVNAAEPTALDYANVLSAHDAESAPAPILLRPLEWINAPFAAFPEAARIALGKVAIVTLLNAMAVIAYVLIFRRH